MVNLVGYFGKERGFIRRTSQVASPIPASARPPDGKKMNKSYNIPIFTLADIIFFNLFNISSKKKKQPPSTFHLMRHCRLKSKVSDLGLGCHEVKSWLNLTCPWVYREGTEHDFSSLHPGVNG